MTLHNLLLRFYSSWVQPMVDIVLRLMQFVVCSKERLWRMIGMTPRLGEDDHNEPLEVQDLKSIVKFCNDFSTLDIEQVRRLVAERDDHTKQVEKSQLQMKELKDELERVTAEKDALKDELERVIAAKDALLTAQSAANGADELNAVTRKEFDDLSKQLAEMNEKISSLETIIRNDVEEVEQTVVAKTVDIEEELKQLGASIDATYKLRDEVADMKVNLTAKVEALDERLSSLGAMVRNDVEELEKKFTRRLAATNDDVDLLMEKVEMTRSANIDRHDFAKELELAGDADDLLDKENSKALAGENHELLMMHGKTPKNYKTPNNKATVNTPRQSPGYSAPTKCSTLRGDQRLKSVLATSSEQNSSVSSTLKYNTRSTKQA